VLVSLAGVRAHAVQIGLVDDPTEDPLKDTDLHIHFPAGATPKDGPSAGVTITTAIVSLLTERVVRNDTAMTGEISLRGQVMPVGGVKEKVLAAHRLGLKQIMVPFKNRKDVVHDVPEEIQADIEFVFAESIDEILRNAFDDGPLEVRPLCSCSTLQIASVRAALTLRLRVGADDRDAHGKPLESGFSWWRLAAFVFLGKSGVTLL